MDNKKVMVLGMGRTGKAVCAFLDREGATAEPFDDAIPIANLSDLICKNYDYAVVSPGVPLTHPAVVTLKTNGVPVLSELDLAYINCPSELVFAISGTNGKTTACTVLHTLLSSVGRSHLVGNVGVPWIGEVKKRLLTPQTDAATAKAQRKSASYAAPRDGYGILYFFP